VAAGHTDDRRLFAFRLKSPQKLLDGFVILPAVDQNTAQVKMGERIIWLARDGLAKLFLASSSGPAVVDRTQIVVGFA